MQQRFTILMLFSLLAISPAIGQTTLRTGYLIVRNFSFSPTTGDSATIAYNSHFQLEEQVNWILDTNSNWNLKSRVKDYTYDANGNTLHYIHQVVDASNTWVNATRSTFTRDANGDELIYLIESWDKTINNWIKYLRYTSTYNSEGKKLSYVHEKWEGTGWVNQQQPRYWEYDANGNLLRFTQGNNQTLYTYNAQNLLETRIAQTLDITWMDKTLAEYTYFPNSTKIATESNYIRFNNAWDKSIRYSNTYDANENLIQRLTAQGNGPNWENYILESYIYNANGFAMEELLQDWGGTNWGNSKLKLFSYDTENRLDYLVAKIWESGIWKSIYQQFNGYDAHSNLISSRQEDWDGTAWNLGYYTRNHYTEFVSTDNPTLTDFEVFPNPANASITLKGEGFSHVMIFDQNGRVVRSQSLHGQAQETLHLGNLPSGNYFLQVLGKDGRTGAKPLQIRR